MEYKDIEFIIDIIFNWDLKLLKLQVDIIQSKVLK